MERKEALQKMAGGILLTAGLRTQEAQQTGRDAFLKDFLTRWENSLAYSLKVLDKMPAGLYDYTPTSKQMPFGKHYTHIGYWNTYFIGNITGQPPFPEPAQTDKATVKDYFIRCHQHCTTRMEQLSTGQLDKTGYGTQAYWQKHTGRDFLLRALVHSAHHRAETLVYLRLNDVEPPFFEF